MILRFNRTAFAAAAMSLACMSAGGQEATGSFSRTVAIGHPVELDVSTGSGGIEIREGGAGQVEIEGRIEVRRHSGRSAAEAEELVRRLESEPPIEIDGGRVVVGHLEDRDLQRNVSISYEIRVPTDASVISRTGSGSQTIEEVASVEAASGSGSIMMTNVAAASARTGSGRIEARGVAGDFDAETGSGSVTLVQTAPGDVDVRTGSGRSDLRGVSGALHVRAGSGSISVEGEQNGDWELETGSGSVDISLPPEAAFELDARTGSGRIETDLPITGGRERGSLKGEVRGGGPLLRVRTGSGSIEIM